MSKAKGQQLPPGWAMAPIEDLFWPLEDGRTLHQGWSPLCEKTPAPTDEDWGVLKTTAIQAGAFLPQHNKHLPKHLTPRPQTEVKTGDILITCAGPRVRCGVTCMVRHTRPRLMMSGKMYRFRVSPDDMDARYLEAFLLTPKATSAIDKMKTGGSDSGLNLTHDRFRPLPVPVAPLNEQRRIMDTVEEVTSDLDAGVAALERVQAKLKLYRAAVLKAAVEGTLVPTAKPYPIRRIGDAIESLGQGWSPKCESQPAADSETWAVIKTTAIQPLRYLEEHNKTLPAALKARPRLELVEGDLLITRAGPRTRVGIACLVKRTRPRLMLCDKAYRLRCKKDTLTPAFLEVVLNAPHIVTALDKLKTGINDSGLNLTQDRFSELLVPYPPPDEQDAIVEAVEDQLSVIEHLESDLEAKLKSAQALRQSILRHAFTGQLVPQDPKDEPAAELLKRIAAQREELARQALAAKKTKPKAPPKRAAKQTRKKPSHD